MPKLNVTKTFKACVGDDLYPTLFEAGTTVTVPAALVDLAVREGWGESPAAKKKSAPSGGDLLDPGQPLGGTSTTDPVDVGGGNTLPLAEVIGRAFDGSDLSVEAWNALTPEAREEAIATYVQAYRAAAAED